MFYTEEEFTEQMNALLERGFSVNKARAIIRDRERLDADAEFDEWRAEQEQLMDNYNLRERRSAD